MARLRFGAFLSPHPPAEQWALARQVEALGYDALWTGDHVSFHNPLYESLTLLASYASITTRIRLGTAVYLLALRHPTVVAKITSTLDALSAGRLIFWARDQAHLLSDAHSRSLARRYPSFAYLPALREAPATGRGEKGEVADAVERLVHSVDRLVVYVCGGGETIQKVREALVRKGMDRKSVKWEKFW